MAGPSAVWLVLASPFTLAHGIAAAHLDLAVAGLLCLALYAALRGSWAIGAVMVGAATAVKAPALLVDAAVVLASLPNVSTGFSGTPIRLRRALEVIALSTATVLVLGLVSGLGTGWVGGLSTPLGHHSPLSPSTELGVHIGALLGLNLVMLAHLMAALLLLAVVGYVVLHAPARSAADVVLAAAAVMSAAILLSPVVHYWYFFWCLPFLACAGLPRRLGRVSVATTVALGLLAPVELTRHHLPFSGTMMLFGLGAALLTVLEPRDARRVDDFLAALKPIYEDGILAAGRRDFSSARDFAALVPRMVQLGALRPLHSFVSRFFTDERVRQAFSFHSLFIGGDPFRVPAIYAALVYLQFLDGVWYARGGVHAVVQAMARGVEDLRCGPEHRVERIATAGGRHE